MKKLALGFALVGSLFAAGCGDDASAAVDDAFGKIMCKDYKLSDVADCKTYGTTVANCCKMINSSQVQACADGFANALKSTCSTTDQATIGAACKAANSMFTCPQTGG